MAPKRPPAPTKWEEHRTAAILLVSIVVVVVLVVLGGRALAGFLARRLPYDVDQTIGAAAAQSVVASSDICTNPAMLAAVRDITSRLAAGLEPEFRGIEGQVVADDVPNAFALPGGYVFVHTGLLTELKAPEELIGVLGHELGHVARRHGIVRLAESVWWRFLIAQLFGDFGDLGGMSAQAIELVSLKFDRAQESESDEFGLELMRRVGYEPLAESSSYKAGRACNQYFHRDLEKSCLPFARYLE